MNSVNHPQSIGDKLQNFVAATGNAIGTLVIGVVSVPVVVLSGVIGGVNARISQIFANVHLNKLKQTQQQVDKQIASLRAKNFSRLKGTRMREAIKIRNKELKQLGRKLALLKGEESDLVLTMQKREQHFRSALIACIPLPFMIFAVGNYLKSHDPHPAVTDITPKGNLEAVFQMIAEGSKQFIQSFLYPFRNTPLDLNPNTDIGFWRASNLKKFEQELKAKPVEIAVDRGEPNIEDQGKINGHLFPAKDQESFDPNKPTMVIFHGNGQVHLDMIEQIKFYRHQGFNVLAATMGGYPTNPNNKKAAQVQTSEMSTYQDANAIIQYLKSQGVKNIGVHGTSIGGSLAFAAAELHPDVVKFVVADQTFVNAKDVANNLISNSAGFITPSSLIRGAIRGGFPKGEIVPGVKGPDGQPYKTDGLDNGRKAEVLRQRGQCGIHAIKSKQDIFMGRNKGLDGFKENFADNLAKIRYNDKEHVTEIEGKHCAWFDSMDNQPRTPERAKILQSDLFNAFSSPSLIQEAIDRDDLPPFHRLPSEFRDNPDYMRRALRSNLNSNLNNRYDNLSTTKEIYAYAPKAIILETLEKYPNSYSLLPTHMQKDPDIMKIMGTVIKLNLANLGIMSIPNREEVLKNISEDEILRALEKTPNAFEYLPTQMQKDPNIMKIMGTVIKQDLANLEIMSIANRKEALKNISEDEILRALEKTPNAFEYLPVDSRTDKIIDKAIELSPEVFHKLEGRQKTKARALKFIEKYQYQYLYFDSNFTRIPRGLREDEDVGIAFIKRDSNLINDLSYWGPITSKMYEAAVAQNPSFLNNKYLVMKVLKEKPSLFDSLSDTLKQDLDILNLINRQS